MGTISSILGSWLMSSLDYSEGVDIFQRLSKDQARVNHFLRFRSELNANRLQKEIDRLYSESKQVQAVQSKEPEPAKTQVQSLRLWLDMSLYTGDNWHYIKGVDLLEAITGEESLVNFFNHHISKYGWVQLRKALQILLDDMENVIAQKQKSAAPFTLVDHLGAWLTGEQNYMDGVELLSKSTSDASLVSFFITGDTPYRRMRLHKELERLFDELRIKEKEQQSETNATPTPAEPHSTESAEDTPLPAATSRCCTG